MRDDLTRIGKRFLADIKKDDVAGLAAELAYRFLFAIFPFVIFVAALTAFVASAAGLSDPTGQILGAIGDNLPPDIADAVAPQLEAVIGTTRPGLLTIGAIAALWAATGGTNALIKAMNRAYEVEETRPLIPRYALAIGLTVLASVGLIAAFVTIVGASLLTAEVIQQLNLDRGMVEAIGILRWPVVLASLSAAVAVLYKLAPNFVVPWRWALVGGAIFSIGWLIATAGFAFYVANFGSYANTYGALGGVIVLMLWFYLSGIILIGAAALVASAMKELQPETFAAGRKAAEEAAREAADAQKRAKEAVTSGRPVAALGEATSAAAAAAAFAADEPS
ncbi:MAG: YihY/virulence factor BrkB family protein, partial [Chloroflexi bacterium]|nr:YihY/virulence factor BrkB family protein [Chloroflexota bacterium]